MREDITNLMPDQLHESPFNPRQHFDPAALAELAYSVAQQGVMQPIVVRPITSGKPHQFEVIFGHRRLRAAAMADLPTVPCIVRPMTDEEAGIAQIHENLKRHDVHPVEEALGYVRLMKDHSVTVKDLCLKTGKTPAYIYARLKLSQLGEAAQHACLAGTIGPEIGVLVARYCRSPKLQARAIELVTIEEPDDNGSVVRRPLPYRQAKQLLRDEFCIKLAQAPFDIADGLLRPYVGACTTCSKNAGNDPELASSSDAGVCTDRGCYESKLELHSHSEVSRAMEQGLTVMPPSEVAKLLPDKFRSLPHGWVLLTEEAFSPVAGPTDDDDEDEGAAPDITFAQALAHMGDRAPKPTVMVHPHKPGVVLHALTDRQAAQVLVHGFPDAALYPHWQWRLRDDIQAVRDGSDDHGGTLTPASAGAGAHYGGPAAHYVPSWMTELDALPPAERAVAGDTWPAVRAAIMARARNTPRTTDDLRLLLLREMSMGDEWSDAVVDAMGWRAELPEGQRVDTAWCRAKLDTLSADDLAAVLVLVAIDNDGLHGVRDAKVRLATAQRYGVDVLAVVAAQDQTDGAGVAGEVDRDPNTLDMFEEAA